MMRILKIYLRERVKYVFFMLGVIGIFSVALLLMDVPPAALVYPVLLSLFLIVLAVVFDYMRAIPKIEEDEIYHRNMQQLAEEYRRYVNDAEYKYQNMMNYYTVWAHQIKTPISSMKLSLQGEDSSLARRLSADLFRIEQYVDMVLVYLRLDSESTDYVFRECNMDDIIKKSVRKFASEFIGRKLSLEYETAEVKVVSDPKWLGFVIEQIVSNSLKYTKEGGIKIYYQGPKVLVIEDTGIGIAKEDLPRIFEKGYTGYNGRNDGNSSGIGLYLVRRVCDNLHIAIRAESQVGKGTKMILDMNQYEIKAE